MDSKKSTIRFLEADLRVTNEAIQRELNRVASSWNFTFGPIHIPFRFGPGVITAFYASFISLCFIAGVVFCFFGGIFAALGAALVVGALFSFGAFVAQFWLITQQARQKVSDSIFDEERLADVRKLADKRRVLINRLKDLHDEDDEWDSGGVEPHGLPH